MTEIMELFGDGLTKKQQDSIQFHLLDQASPKVVDYMCEDALWALKHRLPRYPRVTDPEFRGSVPVQGGHGPAAYHLRHVRHRHRL